MNFTAFWSGLEPNERRLISIAGALSLLVVCYQFILTPVLDQRERAQRSYASNLQTQAEIIALTANVTDRQRASQSQNMPLQAVVSDTSAVFGLSISRLAPVDAGNLNIWLDDVDSQTLLFWLQDMSDSYGIAVSRITISRKDGGKVSANLQVSRTS